VPPFDLRAKGVGTVIVDSLGLRDSAHDVADTVRRCLGIVRTRAAFSATVALAPIPGLDMVADVALIARMIERINNEFGLSPEQIERLDSNTRTLLSRSITGYGTSMVGKALSRALVMQVLQRVGVRVAGRSVARFVPLAGQAVSATLSFAMVRYVGESHVRDCLNVLECVAHDSKERGPAATELHE